MMTKKQEFNYPTFCTIDPIHGRELTKSLA